MTDTARFGYDFGHIPVHPRAEAKAIAAERRETLVLGDKSVDGESDSRFGLVEDNGPDAGTGPKDAGTPAGAPKKAGVDSFEVKWTKNSNSGPKTAKLRLDYSAKFTKDATHDPQQPSSARTLFTCLKLLLGLTKGRNTIILRCMMITTRGRTIPRATASMMRIS